MKLKNKTLFTILATALHEMQKHPEDFKNTLPIAKQILYKLFEDWGNTDEIFIDKMPF